MSGAEVGRVFKALYNAGIAAKHQIQEDPQYDWGGSVEWSEVWDVFVVSRDNEQHARALILQEIGRGSIQPLRTG
jgi:hypothetical protein